VCSSDLELIKDGMFVLTSGGTTIIELARILPPELKASFFTGSIPAAYEYAKHPNIEVIFIGDKISKGSQITVGGEAIMKINSIKPDLCLLGINAIDIANGVTDNDWDVVQVKKAMVEAASKTAVLTITEKMNTCQKLKICEIDQVDYLITELDPQLELFQAYAKAGIAIL